VRTLPEGVPVTTAWASQILSLPMHPDLDDDQVAHVVDSVRSFNP
jgi:dTDP-4-amino-4,6-dideoxygalactose transaminase